MSPQLTPYRLTDSVHAVFDAVDDQHSALGDRIRWACKPLCWKRESCLTAQFGCGARAHLADPASFHIVCAGRTSRICFERQEQSCVPMSASGQTTAVAGTETSLWEVERMPPGLLVREAVRFA